jgi:hypothetical protein
MPNKKESDNATRASIKREMAKPRNEIEDSRASSTHT